MKIEENLYVIPVGFSSGNIVVSSLCYKIQTHTSEKGIELKQVHIFDLVIRYDENILDGDVDAETEPKAIIWVGRNRKGSSFGELTTGTKTVD